MNVLRDNSLMDMNKGHHVYMDNFFSSPLLFHDLSNHWTGVCRTIRVNRQLVSDKINQAKPKTGDPPARFDKDGRLNSIHGVARQDKSVTGDITP